MIYYFLSIFNRKQKQAETDANKPEENKPEGKDGDTEDSEEEGEKSNATNQEPTKKKVAAPKKKFEWNENLRYLRYSYFVSADGNAILT